MSRFHCVAYFLDRNCFPFKDKLHPWTLFKCFNMKRNMWIMSKILLRALHTANYWIYFSVLWCPGIQWQHRTWWCERAACCGTEAGGSPTSAWAPETTSRSSSYRWCTATGSPEEPPRRRCASRTWRGHVQALKATGSKSPGLRIPFQCRLHIFFSSLDRGRLDGVGVPHL